MWRRIWISNSITTSIGGVINLSGLDSDNVINMASLYNDVHILAYFYHWDEKSILTLPTEKRQKYIELIKAQIEAENGED